MDICSLRPGATAENIMDMDMNISRSSMLAGGMGMMHSHICV